MFRRFGFASFSVSVPAFVFSVNFASDVEAGVGTREVTLTPSVIAEAPRTAHPKVLLRSEAVGCTLLVGRKMKTEIPVYRSRLTEKTGYWPHNSNGILL
jgi:hypothetical protein